MLRVIGIYGVDARSYNYPEVVSLKLHSWICIELNSLLIAHEEES